VSPDAVVAALVARAVRRARLILAAESAALGAAVAAWSILAGLIVAVAYAAWRASKASRAAVLAALERATPASRNMLITADELSSGALAARPAVRDRVMEQASVVARGVDVRTVITTARAFSTAALAIAAWIVVSAVSVWRGGAVARVSRSDSPVAQAAGGPATPRLRVTVDVEPPTYTHRASSHSIDPSGVDAVEGSTVHLTIESSGGGARVETSESTTRIARNGSTPLEHRSVVHRSGFLLVTTDDGARRMMTVTVTPDALPAVRLTEPGRDLVYSSGNPRIAFQAQATDDYGLRALVLRYTKVSGSGEQFEFRDGEMQLAIAARGARDWTGSAARSLADLDLHDGDLLVYRAVATDTRPGGGGESSSDAFFVEISRLGVAAGDAFTLPEQETRYALSQQMLIVKTERLERKRASTPPDELRDAAQGLAVEQRMIRSEFVFMLGGEIEDEEVEAEQSTELQEGRLANRGQRDLRAATVAMSQAEKWLTAANTADALKAERAAVAALQRAFTRDRYILRALATRSQLDLSRRLTGTIAQPLGWRRTIESKPANRRAAYLQSLLQGLGELAQRSAEAFALLGPRIGVLAELAVRTDPESQALRRVAADLQQLADAWETSTTAARTRAIDAIAAPVAAEAQRALADPPLVPRGAR
jgi:hypothetical protein